MFAYRPPHLRRGIRDLRQELLDRSASRCREEEFGPAGLDPRVAFVEVGSRVLISQVFEIVLGQSSFGSLCRRWPEQAVNQAEKLLLADAHIRCVVETG
jgi:hypothetical protein